MLADANTKRKDLAFIRGVDNVCRLRLPNGHTNHGATYSIITIHNRLRRDFGVNVFPVGAASLDVAISAEKTTWLPIPVGQMKPGTTITVCDYELRARRGAEVGLVSAGRITATIPAKAK